MSERQRRRLSVEGGVLLDYIKVDSNADGEFKIMFDGSNANHNSQLPNEIIVKTYNNLDIFKKYYDIIIQLYNAELVNKDALMKVNYENHTNIYGFYSKENNNEFIGDISMQVKALKIFINALKNNISKELSISVISKKYDFYKKIAAPLNNLVNSKREKFVSSN